MRRIFKPTEYSFLSFSYSLDHEWIAYSKRYPGYDHYSEIYFFKSSLGLDEPLFVLNENDKDGINTRQIVFSKDNKTVYIPYILSKRRMVYEAAFFGSYDLETKKKDSSYVTLPWSSCPYHLACCDSRSEAYMIGISDTLYIINTKDKNYYIKDKVIVSGKISGLSKCFVDPDEQELFITCISLDRIYVMDLSTRKMISKINILTPNNLEIIE